EVPIGYGKDVGNNLNKVANAVVGGWAVSPILSLHTGFPMSPYGTGDQSKTNSRSSRPNCDSIAKVQGRVPGSGFNGFQYFTNNGNFSNPAVGTFGTCPAQLGWLRGPGHDYIDLSLQKDVHIKGRFKDHLHNDFCNPF